MIIGAFIHDEISPIMHHCGKSNPVLFVGGVGVVVKYFVADSGDDFHGMTFFLFVLPWYAYIITQNREKVK